MGHSDLVDPEREDLHDGYLRITKPPNLRTRRRPGNQGGDVQLPVHGADMTGRDGRIVETLPLDRLLEILRGGEADA